jgi:cell division protein FtsQ
MPSVPVSREVAFGAVSGLLLTVALVAAAPVVWSRATSHPYFVLTSLRVEGNLRITDAEVLAVAGARPGQSVWDMQPRRIEARLAAHPWIRRAQVRFEAPGRVVIEVHERKPVAIVRFAELNYVDRRGHVLGPLAPEDSRNLPIITGLEDGPQRAFAPVALLRVAQLLRWSERRAALDDLSEIHVDRQEGITMFPLEVNVSVRLGWGDWEEKLHRTSRVFAAWEGRLDRLAAIDVSVPEMVIVKMRSDGESHPRPEQRGRPI